MQVASNGSVFDGVVLAVKRAAYVGDQRVTLGTRLACDLALGGFGKLKLAISLEDIFGIELADETVERFSTVGDIVKYIGEHHLADR